MWRGGLPQRVGRLQSDQAPLARQLSDTRRSQQMNPPLQDVSNVLRLHTYIHACVFFPAQRQVQLRRIRSTGLLVGHRVRQSPQVMILRESLFASRPSRVGLRELPFASRPSRVALRESPVADRPSRATPIHLSHLNGIRREKIQAPRLRRYECRDRG